MNSLAKLDELKWIKNVCERCTLNDFDNFSCSIWSFFSCLSSSLIKSFSIFLMSILEFSQPLSKILILYLLMTFVWLARGQLLHFITRWLTLWLIYGKHFLEPKTSSQTSNWPMKNYGNREQIELKIIGS